MREDPQVLLAAERAKLARQQLVAGLTELRERLSPGTIADSLVAGIKSKSVDAVETGVDTVRENRWAVAGIATVGALFFARRPIAAMFESKNDETSEPPARSESSAVLPKDPT